MKTKVCYIISNIDKAIAFEWVAEHLDKQKFELSFVLLNAGDSFLERYLVAKNIEATRISLNSKKDYPKAFLKVFRTLRRLRPDVVHAHLRDANLLGLTAAKLLGIKKRIYTRHHSTFHHDNYPKAVKWDKIVNHLSTDIIAISDNVKQVLIKKEGVKEDKIHLIHHGFDLKSFETIDRNAVEVLKEKYLPEDKYPVIGVIARYINWKGHQYQIEAFKKLKETYPKAFFVFANANGPDKKAIQENIKANLDSSSYIEIGFENNLFALYQLFDVYVHTPVNKEIEAFGQTYVEALAAGIPSVFTLSGVANEFVKDRENALLVEHNNSDAIYKAVEEIIENLNLQKDLISKGKDSIRIFELPLFIKKLENLYE